MASIEEVYEQVVASDDEKAAFAEAAQTPEGLATFLAERGCEASTEEVADYLRSRQGELADDELDSVAGGSEGDRDTSSAGITRIKIDERVIRIRRNCSTLPQ